MDPALQDELARVLNITPLTEEAKRNIKKSLAEIYKLNPTGAGLLINDLKQRVIALNYAIEAIRRSSPNLKK